MAIKSCFLTVLLLMSQGCVRGAIYQDITVPFSVDMDRTPLDLNTGTASLHRLREPFSGAGVGVEWNSYGFGDASVQGELKEASIADLRQQSVLFGIWRRDTLILRGTKSDAKP